MGWDRRGIMSKYLHAEVLEHLSSEGWNINGMNEEENLDPLEGVADDDVFKKLIKIVEDVLSHKPGEQLLTPELLSNPDSLATIYSGNSYRIFSSDRFIDKGNGVDDVLIQEEVCKLMTPQESSKDARSLISPNNKSSKLKNRKLSGKRLTIVRSVLYDNRGLNVLETLYKLRHQSACKGTTQRIVGNKILSGIEVLEEPNKGREKENQITFVTCKRSMTSERESGEIPLDIVNTCERPKDVYSQIHEVIDALKLLMNVDSEKYFNNSHWIEYHIAEIKNHAFEIMRHVLNESTYQSFSTETNCIAPNGETYEVGDITLKTRKKRLDVTLYRIASRKSVNRRTCGSRPQHKNKHKQNDGDEIIMVYEKKLRLCNHQQMKRQEKELFCRLGVSNTERKQDHTHERGVQHKDAQIGRSCRGSGSMKYNFRKPEAQDIDLQHHSTSLGDLCKKTSNRTNQAKNRFALRKLQIKGRREGRFYRRDPHTRYKMSPFSRVTQEVTNKEHTKLLKCRFPPAIEMNFCSECHGAVVESAREECVGLMNKVEARVREIEEKKVVNSCKEDISYGEMKPSQSKERFEREEPKGIDVSVIEDALTLKMSKFQEQSNRAKKEVNVPPVSTVTTFHNSVQYSDEINVDKSKEFQTLLTAEEIQVENTNFRSRKPGTPRLIMKEQVPIEKIFPKVAICEGQPGDKNNYSRIQLVSKVKSDTRVVLQDSEECNREVLENHFEEDIRNDIGAPLGNVSCQSKSYKIKSQQRLKKKRRGSNSPRKSWCVVS